MAERTVLGRLDDALASGALTVDGWRTLARDLGERVRWLEEEWRLVRDELDEAERYLAETERTLTELRRVRDRDDEQVFTELRVAETLPDELTVRIQVQLDSGVRLPRPRR